MAEQVPSLQPTHRMRPETSAWLILLAFFAIFCGLVASLGYAGWKYYSAATEPVDDTMLIIHTPGGTGVNYYASGSRKGTSPEEKCKDNKDICAPMKHEGDRVTTVPGAGYGPVASIVLHDQSQIDLWAHPVGMDLTLVRYRVSKWTGQHQEAVFQQNAGYARYDLRDNQLFTHVDYAVEISPGVRISLQPGGSYSINVPRDAAGKLRPQLVTDPPMLVEVAVRSGSANVQANDQSVTVEAGYKVRVNPKGVISEPSDAEWQLIADGNFTLHSSQEYAQGTETWSIDSGPLADNLTREEQNGIFRITPPTCPPAKPDVCHPEDQVKVGQFLREGMQTKPYSVAITQTLNADVSELNQSLKFSAWTRVLTHTPDIVGIAGSECPILITITYKETSPTDEQHYYRLCIYTGPEAQVTDPSIHYKNVKPAEWNYLEIELRDDPDLKGARYLQKIMIEARGHDYNSGVYGISLDGK